MFHLIKKDKEKEKEKDLGKKERKDKKEKKERMSQAELKSLEEISIRRGFFNLNRGSSKRDSRTRLEISSPIPIKVASNMELCLTDLEAERIHNTLERDMEEVNASTSGENIKGYELQHHRSSVKERAAKFGELAKLNSVVAQRHSYPNLKATSVVHIPEMVEKTFPGVDLQLPLLVAPPIPDPRELELQRRNTGDFGFSLRRTTMLDRKSDGGVCRRVVHFAEPGAGTKDRALGLVPGDRLVEINGANVESKNRDEIVEMIRQSGNTVRLKVQTILELSELNRSWLRMTQDLHNEVLDSDVESSQPQAVTKPELDTGSSPQPTASAAVESNSNADMGGPDSPKEEQSGKKVVRVVRRVVRRVVPAGAEQQNQPAVSEAARAASVAEPVPKTIKNTREDKDDISMGLTSLMGRSRTKEHRPRTRTQDRKEDTKEEVKQEEEKEKVEEEEEKPAEEATSTSMSMSTSTSTSTSLPTTTAPNPAPPKFNPPATFLPAFKPDPLAPPSGFIPAPKQNPLTPPPGFIPAKISSPVPPKPNPLARPPGFIPVSKTDPLAPPAGFVPKPRLFAVKKPESKVVEDPVAILQAAHSAATKGKTEEQITAEKIWYTTDKVWLVHKDGFSLATLLKTEAGSLPEGKVKIRLESDGSLLDVDEDDIEKANPPMFDRMEDLASLQYLNESSVMHSLRQRYGGNLVHTHAGPNMLVINPISAPSMYSEKVMQMFKGCRREDTAPHIYSMAQAAYRNLLTTRQDQSIVLLGKSGSGKTTNCQHIIQYLLTVAGSTNKTFSSEKWQAVYTVLEAFGNASTCMNGNASRFSHIVSLDFDQAGLVTSASIQTMLLEKMRVTRRPDGESTFNVFYYLMAGVDSSLRTELHLNHFAENNSFRMMPQTKTEDKQRASQQFSKLQAAMKVLGISGDEQRAFWLVLGAIYHLGAAGATKAGRKQFARHEWAQKAAYLLGCTLEELSSSIFKHQAKGTLPRASSVRQASDENGTADAGSKTTAIECLEAMASALYSELFTILISFINRALKSSQNSLCSLLIVDTPGFQNPRLAKCECSATFEDLCHNYTQERLHTLFYQRTFVQELERYKEENIELALDDTEPCTSLSVAVVDQASSQALVRTGRTDEARGLLWLMEEEALQPGGSEETLLGRLFSYYGPAEGESHTFLLKSEKENHFLLGHSHGTDWVEYDACGWLNYAKQNPASTNATNLLQDSQKKIISSLVMSRTSGATVLSGSIAGLEGVSQLSLRRATSMRKTFTTGVAAIKKKSLCIQIKLQVDALLDMVRRSRIHFVHCILPKADALKALSGSLFKGGECETQGETGDPGLMQLDVTPITWFSPSSGRRFDVLAPHLTKKHGRNYIVKDEKRAVEELLESLDLEKSSYHMGLSRLFFRAGTLAKLEEQRDEQTKRNLTLFQAACRGYLARQAFKKRKIQDLAIRCIQKNIQKNRGVKDWPWWKLFTTVQPLIKVQLTEEQMRSKDEEIQQQKSKLEKVEKERNELRLNTDRLESRAKFDAVKKQLESQEMEVMEARLLKTSELNGEMDDDDDDDAGGEWRIKYNRAIREMDFTKKKLQQEFDEKLDTEQQAKRHLERRTDNEDVQRSVQQLKKKWQKLTAELQDTKLHLEGLQSRNHDLEKKQRKFDLEQNQAQAEVQREKSQREKLAREKDLMTGEMFNLRQQLQDKDIELCAANVKVQQLEAELQDLSSQESKDEASLAKVKKQLRDLEAKVKDQEEELDEQAGSIQMLEQAKLRLEMEMERQRQTHSKEIEGKDEEVEEIRRSCGKKLKQMEVQLEEEYEDKQKVLRERRELESKLLNTQDQVCQRDVETEKRLKKDLKRTKVLLADAQIMLDHLKSNAPSKREIAQLKNQLEESEFTCAAAVKSRKGMEIEIEDLHIQMEDVVKTKLSLEEQVSRLQREKNDLQSRMEEDQEDMNELMKKHKAAVAQLHSLQSQLEFQEQSMVEKSLVCRQEAKIRELETKLEYERTQIKRLESLVGRLKENLEKMTEERNQRIAAENREKDQNKRMQRQIRDIKEEMGELSKKEAEASRKKHELEMDIESLEAANQSLQVDLKLAFKRIGDLQAAIEDEMESDDNDDLINSGDETETDSEVEDRVDGVKSWLSKNKGSTKTLSEEGSLKSTRYAANADVKEVKEGKEKMNDGSKDGKEVEQSRSVSVMSSLSYRKRSNLKDSIGGRGDVDSLFSTLKEQPDTPDHASIRKAKSKSGDLQEDWKKSQAQEDLDDKGSVISLAYSEATSRAKKGLESRWTSRSSPEFDKDSTVSSIAPSRMSTRRGMVDMDDDNKSTISSVSRTSPRSLHRSTSWKDDRRSSSRLSLARSCGLSEFGLHVGDDDDDDGKSMAFSEGGLSAYSPRSLSRSVSTPAQPRTSDSSIPEPSDMKTVSHRNYLDPDLEAAINEVLSFKPIKFKRSKLDESSDEEEDEKKGPGSEDSRKKGDDEGLGSSSSTLLRSASGSALDYGNRPSSTLSTSSFRSRKDKKSKVSLSDDSSSDDRHSRKSSRGKKGKKSKKRSKKKPSESEDSSSSSESSDSSSSGSTISYRSSSSVKRAPKQQPSDDDDHEPAGRGQSGKKETKKKLKKVDNLVMKYLYRPDSD
ncbi:Unconventional myosin-XVIIIa [Collichthys lucidus]|uniref:Unconventional myosin-XVIIIa n=1 Tax=Collichthys lucidus TaxID=240159 RepID=A0A4U5V6R9_COLLU|nr:Unconventional myosin-XVIIIa [Collichthys lucidus]